MIALLYLAAIAAAELVTALVNPTAGIAFHTILLFSLILHSSLAAKRHSHQLYLALALAPLIRIISLSMPLSQFAQIYWYLLVSVPLLISILVAVRVLNFQPADVGLTLQKMPLQGFVALTGVGFGWVEYHILKVEPLVPTLTWARVLQPTIVFLVTTGFVEELAFRGVMQRSAVAALGPWGWVYIAALFSVLHIGYLSATDWLFVLLVGLFFGWIVKKTGSLLGVILAHGILNTSLYVVFPLVLTRGLPA